MARQFITGVADLEKTLRSLSDKSADRVAKAALRGGLAEITKAQRKAAPVGETGALKKSIGSRLEKSKRTGLVMAKAGLNVGKRKSGKKKGASTERLSKLVEQGAPHAHLVALGTQKRERKSIGGKFAYLKNPTPKQLSTGTMPANPFIKDAYAKAQSKIEPAMRKRAAKALDREAKRASRKG